MRIFRKILTRTYTMYLRRRNSRSLVVKENNASTLITATAMAATSHDTVQPQRIDLATQLHTNSWFSFVETSDYSQPAVGIVPAIIDAPKIFNPPSLPSSKNCIHHAPPLIGGKKIACFKTPIRIVFVVPQHCKMHSISTKATLTTS